MQNMSERMPMLRYLPGGTLAGGIELANRLDWNVTWGNVGEEWYVKGGEKIILTTTSREALGTFLYGLGIAYALLPEDAFTMLEEEAKKAL